MGRLEHVGGVLERVERVCVGYLGRGGPGVALKRNTRRFQSHNAGVHGSQTVHESEKKRRLKKISLKKILAFELNQ